MPNTADSSDLLATWLDLHRVDLELRAEITRRLDLDGELSLPEYEVLRTVSTRPVEGLCMHEIAAILAISRSGVTKLVDRLVERDALARRQMPRNRRVTLAVLTDEGRGLLDHAETRAQEATRQLISSRLTGQDRADLRRIVERLQPPDGACPSGPPTDCA